MSENSNTETEQKSKGTGKRLFEKGDPRINRNGRPKAHDTLRALAQEILAEPATKKAELIKIQVPLIKNGAPVIDADGNLVMAEHYATNVEMVMRQWLTDPKRQPQLIEAAYGKAPQALDVTSGGKEIMVIRFVDNDANSQDA